MKNKKNIFFAIIALGIACTSCNLELNKKSDSKDDKKEIPFQLPRLF